MRVNVYAEEMTGKVELVTKTVEGQEFVAVRFWLYLPVTNDGMQMQGPFLHRPGDDDSSAVTFWGKRELRNTLAEALRLLDEHYSIATGPQGGVLEVGSHNGEVIVNHPDLKPDHNRVGHIVFSAD
jgi:hypothetical protein